MTEELTGLLDGLHFHTLCEQNSDALDITLKAVEDGFGDIPVSYTHLGRRNWNVWSAPLRKSVGDTSATEAA